MLREIEDLKEKIFMCREEYKALYIEKNKLQRKVDKAAGKSKFVYSLIQTNYCSYARPAQPGPIW